MEDASNTGLRLLIAEDDDDDFYIFSLALKDSGVGLNLLRATNGKILLRLLEKDIPDVLLLDILMPLKDGRECLKEIRSNRRYDNLHVIMYTSLEDANSIDDCFNAKSNRYILKPNSVPKLTVILAQIFCKDWKTSMHYPKRSEFVLETISKK